MTELEKVKEEKVTLLIQGKEREIKFGFSAWAKLEKEYGGIKNLAKLEEQIENKPFETLPHLLYIGLVDKEGITEDNILDDYGVGDIDKIGEVFNRAIYRSLPNDEKKAVKEAK